MSSNVCHQIIYLAIELSSSSWVIAYRVPRNDKAKLHRLEAGDGAGLLAFIAGLRHRLDPPDDASTLVVSCFEAGRDGFWLHRLLTAHGVINHVVEPTSILVTRGARRAKTDRLDAVGLLRVLAAKFAGDPGACRTVVVPSVEEEDAKRPIGSGNSWCRSACASKIASPRCSPPRAFGGGRLSVPGTRT